MPHSSAQSAAARAYEHIRSQIVRGDLAAGAFLIEQDLAAEIGVSRTPVRDALGRLQSEGLVSSEGNKRARVRAFTEAEVEECFELRAQFESYAAARTATRITPEAIAELKRYAAQMESVVTQGGPHATQTFSDINTQFHDIILEQAGSPHLCELLRPLLQIQLALMKRYQHTIEAQLHRSCWHHRELIAAFEARDGQWAEAQMRTHMLSAKNPGVGRSDGALGTGSSDQVRG